MTTHAAPDTRFDDNELDIEHQFTGPSAPTAARACEKKAPPLSYTNIANRAQVLVDLARDYGVHLTITTKARHPLAMGNQDMVVEVRPGRYAKPGPIFNLPAVLDQPLVDSQAAHDVLVERQRQITMEGWTPEHDDEHDDGSLACAAACYALYALGVSATTTFDTGMRLWPRAWSLRYLKPKDTRSNLVRAGALIQAEIERLDRLQNREVANG